MPEAWDAEWAIDAALAKAAIDEQFPALAPANVEPLSWGWDNAAFLVNGHWVFRFPRRSVALPLLEREARLLPALAPRLPLPIPVPELLGRPSARFAHPFSGYRLLHGTTGCRANLTADQHAATAGLLARFLVALHSFPADEATRLGVGPDPIGRFDLPARTQKTRGHLLHLAEVGLVSRDELDRFERLMADTPAPQPTEPILLHGDLYSRHLLFEDSVLAGVIDWGDVYTGHRASDMEIAWSFLPVEARAVFREAYGAIDDTTWRLGRFRALGHTAAVLRFAHSIGDGDLLRESRWAFDRILEDD